MKLSHIAWLAVKGSKGIVSKLSIALECSEASVRRYIRENSDDLTKAAALKIIREETGLDDSQILEETEKTAA